jgi:hypothetical protein
MRACRGLPAARETTLAQFRAQRGDLEASLEDVRKIIDRRPGRVSAGKAAECGGTFKIGEAYVYSFLSSYGFDELLPFSRWGRDTQPSIGDGIFEVFRKSRVRSASAPPTKSRVLRFRYTGPEPGIDKARYLLTRPSGSSSCSQMATLQLHHTTLELDLFNPDFRFLSELPI